MAEGKKSFVFYISWFKYFDRLKTISQREALRVLLRDYVTDKYQDVPIEKITSGDDAVDMAFIAIADDLKADLDKYKDKCRTNKENISNYWNSKKKEQEQPNTNEYERKRSNTKNTDNEYDNEYDNDFKKKNNKEKKAAAFKIPTLEEITQYCQERKNLVDPERFFNFYEAKGWMVGKNKMKDWKAAVRTWESEAGFKTDNTFKGFRKLGEEELGFDGYPLVVDGDRFWQMARDNETQAECDARVRATKERIDRERNGGLTPL